MSTHIFKQFDRIQRIKDGIESKILDLAKLQIKIYNEEHNRLFGKDHPSYPIRRSWDYLKVSEYGDSIECWNSYSREPDELVDDFKISEYILNGDLELFRAEVRKSKEEAKTQKDISDAKAKEDLRAKLLAQLQALN